MKRHQALIPLSQDHHHGLLLAQLLKRNAPEYHGLPNDLLGKMQFAIEMFHKELDHHFRDEEEFVFPYLKGKDVELDNLISEILSEHIILKEKILSLKENPNLIDKEYLFQGCSGSQHSQSQRASKSSIEARWRARRRQVAGDFLRTGHG